MNLTKTLLATILVAALAGSALAQGGGRGQGRGMMMGQGGKTALLMRNDVKTDLKITAEQSAALQKIQDEARAEMQNRMEEMRANGGGGFDPQAMRAEMEAFQKKNEEKAKAVLSTEQWNRLGEIHIQLQGNRAILMPEVQKALNMTSDQKNQVETLRQNQEAANMDLMQRMRDGELDREQMSEMRAKNNEILNAELAKVLTSEQAETLKKMGGAPFKADPNEANRRGGGGN